MNYRSRRAAASIRDVARASTPQSLKGLEFPYVLFSGINEMRVRDGEDEESLRRLVYVATTRATDHLLVTVSGRGPLGDGLVRSAS